MKPEEVKLAQQVIGTFHSELDLSHYHDDYQDELRKVIDAKIAGQEFTAPPEEAPEKVVNLMDALRKSLDSVSASRKKTVKAELPKRQPVARVAARRKAR